jgi:hypothetical protein
MKTRILLVIITVIMVLTPIFLFWVSTSPLRSLLLPIKIPVEFDFRRIQSMNPAINKNFSKEKAQNCTASDIVVLKNGTEVLRIKPDQNDLLQFSDIYIHNTAYLTWSASENSYKFNAKQQFESDDQVAKTFNVYLKSPLSLVSSSRYKIPGDDRQFDGLVTLAKENVRQDSILENFSWISIGSSIPLLGGEAETGDWSLSVSPDVPVHMENEKNTGKVSIKYISFFSSPYLYSEDPDTKRKMPICFGATVTGLLRPTSAEISSYISSQISLQVFGWLVPVASLMTILWIDDRYRDKIRKKRQRE